MSELQIFFPVDDIELEGVLHLPETNAGSLDAVIVCHPHTDFGGNMHNNVVMGLSESLVKKGFAAFRFNFRGAGRSGGRCQQGVGEVNDTAAAIDFLEHRPEIKQIFLAGYSFGAMVGLQNAVNDSRVKAWVAASPPFILGDFDYLVNCPKPKLLFCGDRDDFCPADKLKELFSRLKDPKEMRIFDGNDHFYWGFETKAGDLTSDFLSRI